LENADMLEVRTRSRWWVSIRGLVAIVFAVRAVAWPDKAWFTLLSLYTYYALVDGIALFIQATKGGRARRVDPWPLLFVAILGVAAGIGTLFYGVIPTASAHPASFPGLSAVDCAHHRGNRTRALRDHGVRTVA
jgi:uncharacterized membrane protein HdeD (DUF308 family)